MAIRISGTTISGIDLQGCIRIYATNVTIKNSRIHCGGPYGVFSYEGDYSGGGALIEDTEVDCMNTQATGIASCGFNALRVNVPGCENGFAVDFNVTIQDSYVWGLFTNDPNTAQAGHSDGIQMGGNNNLITHNTIFNLSDVVPRRSSPTRPRGRTRGSPTTCWRAGATRSASRGRRARTCR
jgi:hypothetical protein